MQETKRKKSVFVIMPFTETPSRNQQQLTSFFSDNIKKTIEADTNLDYEYIVWRSGETFNITDQIIRDLFRADIVIADLSGKDPNPNVMYELGVRLTLSAKPVILIREKNPENKKVFDVDSYYIHHYDPLSYQELESHLIEKLRRFETGEELYESPVKSALRGVNDPSLAALDQRKKLLNFCSRVEGAWWQRIIEKVEEDDELPELSISFIQFEPDIVTNEVYIHGDTFDKNGEFLGRWWSEAVGIMESQRMILYVWEAKLPTKHPGIEFKGFGEFKFEESTGIFGLGDGRFMNTRISDPPISWWKAVDIRRITEERHLRIMTEGGAQEKRELVIKILSEW
ncbi:MAG: hypothetical protein JSW26_14450 [Desulfobacterales bacterium]|nr:MAG: hypothetical protein JSW26_14450 [Desulfobacterales bacterium]